MFRHAFRIPITYVDTISELDVLVPLVLAGVGSICFGMLLIAVSWTGMLSSDLKIATGATGLVLALASFAFVFISPLVLVVAIPFVKYGYVGWFTAVLTGAVVPAVLYFAFNVVGQSPVSRSIEGAILFGGFGAFYAGIAWLIFYWKRRDLFALQKD